MRVLVTGAAGFIGYHLCERLLGRGDEVHGIDNLNPYYDPRLKEARLAQLMGKDGFRWTQGDLADKKTLDRVFADAKPEVVVNLAAQVGVRWSKTHPQDYIASNLIGFANLLECVKASPPRHLVFASSSSVYGANTT